MAFGMRVKFDKILFLIRKDVYVYRKRYSSLKVDNKVIEHFQQTFGFVYFQYFRYIYNLVLFN